MSTLAGLAADLTVGQGRSDDGPSIGSRVLTLLAAVVRALLLLVCLLPLVYMDTIYPAVVGKALYSRILIECAFAGWLLLALCSADCRPRKSWIMAALFAWLLVSLASAMVGVSPTRSLWSSVQRMTGVVDLAHWTVYAVMLASMFRDRRSWGMLLLANVGASGVVGVWAVAPYFLSLTGIAEGGVDRVSGPFGNALSLGVYASVSAGLTVALMTLLRSGLWTPILGIILVLNLSAVWISGTRSGLVALLVMFAVLAVSWAIYDGGRRLRVWIVVGALTGVLLLGGALAAWSAAAGAGSSDMMVNRLASGFSGKNRSIEGRIQAGTVAVEATVARPVLGYGPENFVVAWGEFWPREWRHRMVFDHAHNKFLEVSATTGFVGLTVYASLWILLMLRAVRAARGRGEVTGMLGVAMLATLAGYLVMTMVMVDDAAFLLHFALLAGYLACVETETARGMAHRWVVNLRSIYAGAVALSLGLGLSYCVAQYNVAIYRFAQVSPVPADIAEFVENERRLMDNFPALSNLRRFRMLITLAGPADLDPAVMASVDADIRAGRSIDPTDWLLPVAATILYQRATSTGLDYLAESEYYLALVRQHSPQSSIIVELERRQRALTTR